MQSWPAFCRLPTPHGCPVPNPAPAVLQGSQQVLVMHVQRRQRVRMCAAEVGQAVADQAETVTTVAKSGATLQCPAVQRAL